MKVLHIVASIGLRHGGVSVSVRELCRSLSKIGIEVHLWTTRRAHDPNTDEAADQMLRGCGIAVQYFPVHPWHWLGQRYAYSPALAVSLRKALAGFDLAHIHGLWLYTTYVAARMCQRFQVPYLLSPCGALDPYGFDIHPWFKQWYGFWIERQTLAAATTIHFTSPLEQRRAKTFGIHRPSVVIPRSICLEEIPTLPQGTFRRRYPEVANRRILLFLGRLQAKKRLDLVAEAFVAVARRRPDVHLVIAGPDEGSGHQAREIISQANLSSRVTFTGLMNYDDKWTVLRDSDLFLLPSLDENFGVSVLEAMAVGVPVLVTSQVALAEAVRRAGAGLVIDGNSADWAAAIDRLLDDSSSLQSMGAAGRRLVEADFLSNRIAAAMRDAYRVILKNNSQKRP